MANFYPSQSASRFVRANSVLYTGNATTTLSTTFLAQTRQIRVVTNVSGGVYVVTAESTVNAAAPTVSNITGMFVAANNFPEYFTVNPGQIIAINSTSTSTGIVCVTEMTN